MIQKLDQKIGHCTFHQLPQEYQTLFSSGANHTELGTFIPQKHPVGVMLLSIPFTGFFAATPILFITDPKYDVALFSPLGILLILPFLGFLVAAVRTIVIETVPTNQSPYDEIRPGTYRFHIKVQGRLQGKYYMLSFDRPFYGTRNWRGGQKFESVWP